MTNLTTHDRIPVTLLTGFLGSGKTTLLRELLADTRMARTAVIINEIGEVGLDHLLVGTLDDDAVLLKSGCVCCTMKSEFGDTLKSLFNRRESGVLPNFNRVIVETTGLADPVPLVKLLLGDEGLVSRFRLQAVVTTVDCQIGALEHRPRVERDRQIGIADHLVLTKTDLVSTDTLVGITKKLRDLYPDKPITNGRVQQDIFSLLLENQQQPLAKEMLLRLRPTHFQPSLSVSTSTHNHKGVHTFCLSADEPIKWAVAISFLRWLARTYSHKLLRMKGILNIMESDKPIIVQGVEHYLFPETSLEAWPGNLRSTQLIIIGDGLPERDVREKFSAMVLETK
ncbi:GTPase, G3E family [Pseudomonas sp. NFACC15-1]|uniref:CobW family GTP-binding protein n=2 Tax=unclassified Pseudomonas TaxID=196821 RepID=UPI000890E453|nr:MULTISPECIES: GTP-binding protein [unclassified Pseudomonas]SDA51226.1 GTPase, G3E family [Pseudomonas sp. NFACC15-1]SDB67223.1 GTPase, G3E family [Pseudomonas sp. NFACC13-1]SDW81606.1 GTPase, G3E family [Pseudomonas sp. NFACC14]